MPPKKRNIKKISSDDENDSDYQDSSTRAPPQKKQKTRKQKVEQDSAASDHDSGDEEKSNKKKTSTKSAAASKIDEQLHFAAKDRATWRQWLHDNHKSEARVWLIYHKKQSKKDTVAYAEAVEEALCYGWIDSTIRPVDEERYKQLFTPRKAKSVWSKVNKERVAKLIANGQMMEAGLASITIAKKNNSWESLDDVENMVIPTDLQKAFDANETAKQNYDKWSRSGKKSVLYYMNSAKRQETRDKRIAEIIESCEKNIALQAFRQKNKG